MRHESYHDVARAFDWAKVHEDLGWAGCEMVSLGTAIVDRHAAGERVALIWVGRDGPVRRLSYRELSEASNRFANMLRRLRVEPGDRVAGLMPRVPETLIAMIGALKLGAIYVPIFTGFGSDAIRFRLEHCGAEVLVTHHEVRRQVPAGVGVRIVCVASREQKPEAGDLDLRREIEREAADFQCVPRHRDDPAAIIYTSGSTGPPKGGAIAVNFLAAVWPYIVYGLDLRREEVFWPTGDPGWGYGFVCYLGALAAGATIVCVEANPTPQSSLSILAHYQITNFATTPTLLRGLMALGEEALRRDDLRLHAVSSCGEPLNSNVVDFFRRAWNLTPMDHFGATEYALPIGNYNGLSMTVKAGSMGLPSPGYRMAIVDEDRRELPAGVVGLIGKRPDANCRYWLRYWNDAVATRELVRRGWIVTGDLGRRDEDGYFWFEGRADDMIKSAGYRIGPFEVESALLKHPAVAEAAVIGGPDAMRGQIVKAYVVLRPGLRGSEELSQEIARSVKATLGSHQYPRELEFVDTLPKTETGKIKRFVLRERA
jgi:acetyl-CoA synthetase